MCSTDLTNEGEQNRQKHVNECLDKFSKKKPSVEEASETKKPEPVINTNNKQIDETKTAKENVDKKLCDVIRNEGIPNCPICGKILHTLNVCILINQISINLRIK